MYIDLKLMGESWDRCFEIYFFVWHFDKFIFDFVQIRYKLILLKEFNHFWARDASIPREDNTWYNLQLEHYSKKTYWLKNKYIAVFFTDLIYFANHGWNFCTVNNFNSIKSLIYPTLYDHDSLHFLFESKRRL